MTPTRFAAASVAVLALLALGFLWLDGGRGTLVHATLLPEPRPVSRVQLVDMRGQAFDIGQVAGEWQLMFFGFANCPDICPITLQQLATARRRLAEAGVTPLPGILFISVDPARDSPTVLAEYAARFGEGVIAATGDADALRELAGSLGIYFEAADDGSDSYEVSHSAAVLLINPDGELHALFSAPQDVDALVNDIAVLTGA